VESIGGHFVIMNLNMATRAAADRSPCRNWPLIRRKAKEALAALSGN
jgi:hypothetical protein